MPHADLAGATDEIWHRIFNVNVMGTWYMSRAAVDALRRDGGGSIVNVTSVAGVRPAGSSIPYAASKAALNHLTLLLANVLGPDIRVNAVAAMTETLRLELVDQPVRIEEIAPGMVRTEEFSLTRFGGDQERADAVYAGVSDPLVAADVAEAIVWMVQRPAHVNIDLLVIKPRVQAAPHKVHRTPTSTA